MNFNYAWLHRWTFGAWYHASSSGAYQVFSSSIHLQQFVQKFDLLHLISSFWLWLHRWHRIMFYHFGWPLLSSLRQISAPPSWFHPRMMNNSLKSHFLDRSLFSSINAFLLMFVRPYSRYCYFLLFLQGSATLWRPLLHLVIIFLGWTPHHLRFQIWSFYLSCCDLMIMKHGIAGAITLCWLHLCASPIQCSCRCWSASGLDPVPWASRTSSQARFAVVERQYSQTSLEVALAF